MENRFYGIIAKAIGILEISTLSANIVPVSATNGHNIEILLNLLSITIML